DQLDPASCVAADTVAEDAVFRARADRDAPAEVVKDGVAHHRSRSCTGDHDAALDIAVGLVLISELAAIAGNRVAADHGAGARDTDARAIIRFQGVGYDRGVAAAEHDPRQVVGDVIIRADYVVRAPDPDTVILVAKRRHSIRAQADQVAGD